MYTEYLNKFYQKNNSERIEALQFAGVLPPEQAEKLSHGLQLDPEIADKMIENQLATYQLPYGVALNFLINGKEFVVPMAIEEPSVIAAASAGAKLMSEHGGITARAAERLMIGQVAFKEVPSPNTAAASIREQEEALLQLANEAHPSIVKRGGGARHLEIRHIPADETFATPSFLIVHFYIDTQEAMGANMINTMMEAVAPRLEELTGSKALMGILSNYSTECLVTATCRIPVHALERNHLSGEEVRDRIVDASLLATADPFRAVTHNKGIMNGVDAVVMASGNDWRAISAAVHAYAARSGQYRSLTSWITEADGSLMGSITLPMPVGSVGGSISFHPGAQMTQTILGQPSARELEMIIAAVGLAQNFSAIRALVTEGIQKGHMSLQARSLAISAGAQGEEIEALTAQLRQMRPLNLAVAKALLDAMRQQ